MNDLCTFHWNKETTCQQTLCGEKKANIPNKEKKTKLSLATKCKNFIHTDSKTGAILTNIQLKACIFCYLKHSHGCKNTWHKIVTVIDQFRYIKIQSQTIDLRTRLWGINPTNSVFIPQSLVLRSIVWGWILIYRNWSIHHSYQKRTFLFLSIAACM